MEELDPDAQLEWLLGGSQFADGNAAKRARYGDDDASGSPAAFSGPPVGSGLPPGFDMSPPPPTDEMLAAGFPFAGGDLPAGAAGPALRPGGLWKTKLCIHFDSGQCRRGPDCSFAHGVAELANPWTQAQDIAHRPTTTRMDFSKLDPNHERREVHVPRDQADVLMTDVVRQLFLEASGVSDVQWDRGKSLAILTGTKVKLDMVEKQLQRVIAHCNWGASEQKIRSVLNPRKDLKTARCRLSGMVPALKDFSKTLSAEQPQLTIGTDPSNHLRVRGPLLSRTHVLFEFSPERGAVYVIDCSTNGTFLNGKRLPAKASGKVLLWHGDELLFQEPGSKGDSEFGYMVNLEFL